jgi:cell division transport system permease protein
MAGRKAWVTLLVMVISFVAALESMEVSATIRTLRDWPARLAGSVTLSASGQGVESPDAAAARAVEILTEDPRVARAWVLNPTPGDSVAAAIMGARADGDVGQPRLIGAAAKPGAALTAHDVLGLMDGAGISAVVDDHGLWSGPLERTVLLGAVGAAALLLVLIAALLALVSSGVRGACAGARPRLTLLLHLGASDAMLIKPLRARFVYATVLGAVLGTIAAAGLASAMIWSPATAIWFAARSVPAPPLHRWDLAAGLIWLAAATLLAPVAASGAARAGVRSLA